MSVPEQDMQFVMDNVNFNIKYDNIFDIYNVELTSPQFRSKFTFKLINHHASNVVQDLCSQMLERICSEYFNVHQKDLNFMVDWFRKNGIILGISKDFVEEVYKYMKLCSEQTITPWLQDDYSTVLKTLKEMGFNVELVKNYKYFRCTVDCYVFTKGDTTFATPARHPVDWCYSQRHNNFDERPFYSISKIFEGIKDDGPKNIEEDLIRIKEERKDLK